MRELVNNNPEETKYFFIIDSVDGCIRKEDLDKGTQEAVKVAGGALLTSEFLKRMTLKLGKLGHVCILIHQNRSKIQLNQYEKKDPNNITQSSAAMLVCIIQIGFLSLWTKIPKAVELEAQNQNLLMQIQRAKSLVIFAESIQEKSK